MSRYKRGLFTSKVDVSNGNLNYGLNAGTLTSTIRNIEHLECMDVHTHPWQEEAKSDIEKAKSLQKGWDGYSAPRPNVKSLSLAEDYLEVLINRNEKPHRVGPAALGGMAFIHKGGVNEGYVLISNAGEVLAMFINDGDIPDPISFEATRQGFEKLVEEIRDHLG
jgi:hypothetical protein